jgi:flagellar biosynthesis regulator FlaF
MKLEIPLYFIIIYISVIIGNQLVVNLLPNKLLVALSVALIAMALFFLLKKSKIKDKKINKFVGIIIIILSIVLVTLLS